MSNKDKPLILIAEDDVQLVSVLQKQLEMAGMSVQAFYNGQDTINYLKRDFANILLLDVGLPDMDGFEVLDNLQKNSINTPVIFVTAFSDEFYKIKCFESGADDFITKPFSFTEMIARINAVLRRSTRSLDLSLTSNTCLNDDDFEFCGAKVKPSAMSIEFPNGSKVDLGKKELGILSYLANNPNTIISRRSLIHNIWGKHANLKSRSLDQYIVKLRQMFKAQGVNEDYIKTMHGVGYMYTDIAVMQ